jgi:uncharacterized protein (DUF1697 family)
VALVVLLRGVNVGGHRTFRPSALAQELKHLDAVNIGAAGTFVIHRRVSRAELRAELARRLPFDADIVICRGLDIARLVSLDGPDAASSQADIVRFVSVLTGPPRLTPRLPVRFPPDGPWLVEIVSRNDRFVIGRYRRHMKTIGYLGMLDRIFGVPVTTRNWNTMTAIVKALDR